MARNRARRNAPVRVTVEQLCESPVAVLPETVSFTWSSPATELFPPNATDLPLRPTSMVVSLASSSPASWIIRATSAGVRTYESRPFVTCGNSITVKCRNSKSSMYALYSDGNVVWSIECSGTGMAEGVAYFSGKGTSSVL